MYSFSYCCSSVASTTTITSNTLITNTSTSSDLPDLLLPPFTSLPPSPRLDHHCHPPGILCCSSVDAIHPSVSSFVLISFLPLFTILFFFNFLFCFCFWFFLFLFFSFFFFLPWSDALEKMASEKAETMERTPRPIRSNVNNGENWNSSYLARCWVGSGLPLVGGEICAGRHLKKTYKKDLPSKNNEIKKTKN